MTNSNLVRDLIAKGHDASTTGRVGQARASYKKALDLDPHNFDACFFVAATYAQQENFKMASAYFRRAFEVDPTVPEGAFNLAYALQLQALYEEAAAFYEKALELRPNYHQALHNLGGVYEEIGELNRALELIDRAIESKPDAEESHYNRGSILMKLNRFDEALVSFDQALKLKPTHVKALNNRGFIHLQQTYFVQALDDFSKALALDPEDAELHYNKAKAASKAKNHALAVDSYRATLKLNPENSDAWLNLAFELESLKRYKEALPCFERTRKLKPDTPFIDGYIHSCRLHDCDWSRYFEDTEIILKGLEKGRLAIQAHAALQLPASRAHFLHAARAWVRLLVGFGPHDAAPQSTNKKIKVGYFSPDFHSHPVAMLSTRLLELHDRDRFEVYAFSMGVPSRDPWRLRVEKAADHFINIRDMSDDEIVALTRREQLDIAVDMAGYTAETRTSIFWRGVAPVQVNYLGFSGSMGADFIHYIIGDLVLIPTEHEADYTEKVVRLPHSYMPTDPTRPISNRPMTRREYGLPDEKFVFCGFNNVTKLNPLVFSVWMQILKEAPDSVLWLSPATEAAAGYLRSFAKKQGIEGDRIIFSRREDKNEDHLARQRLADLFLDAFPHNAHATSCDALWSGLPILTKIGQNYAARVAASLLNAIGMPEMVVETDEDYVRRALDIALTPGESKRLKAKLAHNLNNTPLFQIDKYTRDLETAYCIMHERSLKRLPPENITIAG